MQYHQKDTICSIRAVYYKTLQIVINYATLLTDFIPYDSQVLPKMKAILYFENSRSTFLKCWCNKKIKPICSNEK